MPKTFFHASVMPKEVMSYFDSIKGKIIVDATAGGGGHLALLAENVGETGRIIAFDRDPRAHQDDASGGVAKKYPWIKLYSRPFSEIRSTLKELGIEYIDGLLCDLGVSSHQLDDPSRGFSFQTNGPIDMRMDTENGLSAFEWLATTREQEIADVLYTLGGERKSRQIAARIKKDWPIENSTLVLAKLILSAMRQQRWSKTHPATKTFQAIRMAVNGEVDEIKTLLQELPLILSPAGRAVFLTFHSGEDRLIKLAFRELAQKERDDHKKFKLLTKKPAIAEEKELEENRRARSAKLRAIERVA